MSKLVQFICLVVFLMICMSMVTVSTDVLLRYVVPPELQLCLSAHDVFVRIELFDGSAEKERMRLAQGRLMIEAGRLVFMVRHEILRSKVVDEFTTAVGRGALSFGTLQAVVRSV
jgi:hypothetical protein